jgi:RNA polymerase sigma-70 factor (ECF subfamily)
MLLKGKDMRATIAMDYTTIATAKLIEVCTDGDAGAWQEFIRRFHSIIAITASRAARRWGEAGPQIIDDLIEETYLKLSADWGELRRLRFEHEDGIPGFLKVFTVTIANDYLRALNANTKGLDPRICALKSERAEGESTIRSF